MNMHPTTRKQLQAYLKSPYNGLLVMGEYGSGAEYVLEFLQSNLYAQPDVTFHLITAKDKSIGVEQIQELLQLTKHKQGNTQTFLCITEANKMTHEAQNALLKQLEEPINGVYYILITEEDTLLPTVVSRCKTLRILPLSKNDAFALSRGSNAEVNYLISGGRAAIYVALEKAQDNVLTEDLSKAKNIVVSPLYNRIIEFDSLLKDKIEPTRILNALLLTCHAALFKSSGAEPWQKKCRAVLQANKMLNSNVQVKLVYDYIAVSLG